MIKFNGKINGECLKFISKKHKAFYNVLAIIVVFIIFVIPTVIFSILYSLWLLFILFLSPFFIFVFSRVDNDLSVLLPIKVEISEVLIEMENKTSKKTRLLSDIKNVIDYGKWYIIQFYKPQKDRYFICQKDLLVEGNIEDFERLLNGKFIRKTV
ncbi:MAG: hypothetical protein IJW64_06255 [Clostridia bacterium]|nr:hypothetical protein [Clostridia bacterium]